MNQLEYRPEEVYSHFSLKIQNLNRDDFNLKRDRLGRPQFIPMDTWYETVGAIENIGASPCVIIYVRSLIDGQMISGHFLSNPFTYSPEMTGEDIFLTTRRQQAQNDNTLVVVSSIDDISRSELHDNNLKYYQMLARLKEWVKEYKAPNIEAYLFGQNFSSEGSRKQAIDVKRKTHTLLDRFNVAADLRANGLQYDKIADFRAIDVGYKWMFGDSTVYDPMDKTIYLLRTND